MTDSVQKYIQGDSAVNIASSVEAEVRNGRLAPGEVLPPVRTLASHLGVSPGTVAAAYAELGRRGIVVAEGRRGTRVSARRTLAGPRRLSLPPHAVDLASGGPDPKLLPRLRPALARIDATPRGYDNEASDPRLLSVARERLLAEGVRQPAHGVAGGAMDGLERALRLHCRAGDTVLVEDPGFSGVLDLIASLGLRARGVAIDSEGMLPAALSNALTPAARAVIVTPRAQNPTGARTTAARARTLGRVLRDSADLLLLEDDHAGPISGAPLHLLPHRGPHVLVQSVSKSLGPDLRLAILAGDVDTLARMEDQRMVGMRWVSHILQQLVCALWESETTLRTLERATKEYARRRTALIEALERQGIAAVAPSGLNVWIPVREEIPVIQSLAEAGWGVTGGEGFRLNADPAIRVTIAQLRPADAPRLAKDLAACLASRRGRGALV